MAVKIGSARIDERGKISGGKAGDQTGREVSTQNWYEHSKGWVVLRCKVPGMAKYIAQAMKIICADNDVGYDQSNNKSLWKYLDANGFDVKNIKKAVETDCARLVRVCVQWAANMVGLNVTIPDCYTANLVSKFVSTGLFEKLTSSKYTEQDDYLEEGMILCTRTKGHVVVVLTNGDKAGVKPEPEKVYALGERILRDGCKGADVKELQGYLIQLDYDLGKWADDGDFGDQTELAVMKFQREHDCDVDGEVGPETLKAIENALEDKPVVNPQYVKFTGDSWLRTEPSKANKKTKVDVVKKGYVLPYLGQQTEDGWLLVEHKHQKLWVSGMYSELIA